MLLEWGHSNGDKQMWINGRALHEISDAQLQIEYDRAFNDADYVWSNAIRSELLHRDRNPEYRVA